MCEEKLVLGITIEKMFTRKVARKTRNDEKFLPDKLTEFIRV